MTLMSATDAIYFLNEYRAYQNGSHCEKYVIQTLGTWEKHWENTGNNGMVTHSADS